jgi:hypothetical protein
MVDDNDDGEFLRQSGHGPCGAVAIYMLRLKKTLPEITTSFSSL